jgi:hypothetical protein
MDAGDNFQQVRELRPQRKMGLEVLDVDVDLVDLYLRNIDKDVRVVAWFSTFQMPGVQLAGVPGTPRGTGAIGSTSVAARLVERELRRERCAGITAPSDAFKLEIVHRARP